MNRDALVVGIRHYDHDEHFRPLDSAPRDAEAIAQRLEQDGEFRVWRFPEAIAQGDRLKPTVSATQAFTQKQLEAELEKHFLPDSDQLPDTVLFYFSGHGMPDRKGFDKGYLAASDTHPDEPRSGLSLRWLQWLLSKSPIKRQIVWLDCCHSGGLLIDIEAANPGHGDDRDRCFIASSRDFEESWQDLNSPYSVLTKALLDGLEPSRLPGRWVDSFALVDYVNQAMRGELQTPICTNFGLHAIDLVRSFQAQTEPLPQAEKSEVCPYKGLEYFDCNDRDPQFFFGREALTSQLLDKVRTDNFLALVGASGSGKSSVLRAGLLHQLQQGRRIAGSDRWQVLVMRPDATPLKNLAEVLVTVGLSQVDRAAELSKAQQLLATGAEGLSQFVRMSEASRVVLVIDQFEEAFTRCTDVAVRRSFFACVLGALALEPEKFGVIVAMRSDFVGKCLEQEYSGLARAIEQNLVSVLPMTPEELKAAIVRPADRVGATVEDLLVETILKDIQTAPGRLPLLQYALTQVWNKAADGRLTLSDYRALGGIDGTLQVRATQLYEGFSTEEQATCRHIFLALTQLGEGTEDTRRRVVQGDLVSAAHPVARVEAVLGRLAAPENRLLVTSVVDRKGATGDRVAIVDVAHEALIREWQLLRGWVEASRDVLRQGRRIEDAAREWRDRGEKPGYLLEGLRLDEAREFRKRGVFALSESAGVFIGRSVRWRWRRRVQAMSWLVIPALVVVGLIEYQLREQAVKEDYARLDSDSQYEEMQAVQDLVRGCRNWQEGYIAERLFGNCRSLRSAPLEQADLRDADLSDADLSDANLSEANLSEADLSDANLSDANLSDANLSDANLSEADLSDANLRNADLRNADLGYANLSSANLSDANLRNADLSDANLGYANLISAYLSDANLSDANLSDAYLRNANLRNAYLISAYLSDAYLSDADLSSAYLSDADLSSANLSDANLSSANLRNANLSSANLISANLSSANLSDANLNESILLATDLRQAQNLIPSQFIGDDPPFLCNAALPQAIQDAGVDPDRDCEQLPQILQERYLGISQEEAQETVDEARQKQWD